MRGISSSTKDTLGKLVDQMFDKMAVNLLGYIPAYRSKKSLLFSYNPTFTLAHLFLQALGSERPLPKEEEALKNLLDTAHEYVQSLRSKTKAQLSESVDSYVKEARSRGETPSESQIRERLNESLSSASKHMKTIVQAEATKARNTGKMFNIAKVGASIGQSDPTVFFVVIKDNVTCEECKRLHMMPDGITPRVWKLSELGFSYHKKGQDNPKVCGLHPHCRCTLTLLAPGFGFKGGSVTFISPDHDELKAQRG